MGGIREDRADTISVFNGPPPDIQVFGSEVEEIQSVANWIEDQHQDGVMPHEFGLFVRSADQLERATSAAEKAGLPCKILDDGSEGEDGHISISTMHLAKGLEFAPWWSWPVTTK